METETHMADLLVGRFVMLGGGPGVVLIFRRSAIGAVLGI